MSAPLKKIVLRKGSWEEFRNENESWKNLPTVQDGEKIVYKPDAWDTTDLECGIDFIGQGSSAPEPPSSYQLEERLRLDKLVSERRNA